MATRRLRHLGVLVLGLALVGAACGDDDDDSGAADTPAATAAAGAAADGETHLIAFFSDSDDNAWVQAGIQAGKDMADAHGVDIDVFAAGWDPAKQLTQLQDAIATGKYDAYVVESIDGQTLCKPLTELVASGAIVSIFNTPICGDVETLYTDGTVGYFGRDEYQGGKLLGQQAAESIGGKGTVAYISGPVANSIVQLTTKGFRDGLAAYPDVKLVAELPGDWDAGKGLAATQDLMTAHPDVDVIAYGVDQMMVPSVKWLREQGKLSGLEIVTEGGSSDAFDLIKAGDVHAAVAGLPYTEAANGTLAAISALQGKPVDVPGWDSAAKVADYLEDPIFAGGPPVITTANVATLKPEWTAS